MLVKWSAMVRSECVLGGFGAGQGAGRVVRRGSDVICW